MKYTVNDTPISLTYENTYDLHPTLKDELDGYVESRPKIKDVRVFLNGLTTPIEYSIGLHLIIDTGSVQRLIEVDYLDNKIFNASIIHKDGTVEKLSDDVLYEISNDAKHSDDFMQVMLDGITLAFLDHMLEPTLKS